MHSLVPLAFADDVVGVFRADHARIISHAEEIAFLRGGAVERARVSNSFATIVHKAQVRPHPLRQFPVCKNP